MPVIRIQQNRAEASSNGEESFHAIVSFNHGVEYPITVSKPFSDKEEQLLEWYFEDHLRFPFTDNVKAQTVAASISTYGENLFQQIFTDPKIYRIYNRAIQAGPNTLQFEIAGPPKFHALHWEALKDPELPQPFALQAIMVRKNMQDQVIPANVRSSPTINLLIVTARPFGKRDVGYRTISQPLVDVLRKTELPVKIDILRPGTYKALENHLREVSAKQGVGYYHVIHFDVHGAVLTYDQFKKGQQANRYVYRSYGRNDIEPYQGSKAFLFLESEQDDKSDPVEAIDLAKLLLNHQVPIAILNACQSGKQVGDSETSLGSRLMQAGVQLVLAMGYSVTVSAAQLLMKTLYQHLFDSQNLSLAICQARTELYNNKARQAYYNQTIDLEDWLLPVVYQNQPQQLSVCNFTPDEREAHFERLAEIAAYAVYEPSYGFVGRDLDILQIEKRLLTKCNILLVRGMGGAGKTTLLRHLSTWWRTTGLVNQVFYFGYDEQAWNRQQILVSIAQQLLGQIRYLSEFQSLSLDAQHAMLTQLLRAQPHLLILDNLESITGSQLAIQHTLTLNEQAALHRFLTDLAGGRTLVLLGSRSDESWLAKGTFENNIYDLEGLDPEAASILAERILERHNATKYRENPDLQKLIKLLDGFPLALEIVLANLARQTPTDILNSLQAGNINLLDKKESEKKTESIVRCISYSHSNLSPEAQQLLLCLAPFTSVIYLPWLDNYTASLRKQPALSTLPFERWPKVIDEAQNWGLLSPHPDLPTFLRLQPILPYFLRERLNEPEQDAIRQSIEIAFREHYDMVGHFLDEKLKEPQEHQQSQIFISLEYENLINALNLALKAQVSFEGPYFALSDFLNFTQDHQRGLELGQTVLKSLELYSPEKLTGSLGHEFTMIIHNIASKQLLLKRYTEAEISYKKALSLLLESRYLDQETIKKQSAFIYHHLGIVALEQRQWQRAEQYFQHALQIYIECNDRYEQANPYQYLGRLAQKQRQWQQAEQYYQHALQIYIESNDRYEQAGTYHHLGIVAQEQRQWEQAEQYFQHALQLKIEFNYRFAQASTYHNLGAVAQEQRQWEQAEQYYQHALQINIEFNARYEQASTYHQLGNVAQEQRQWQQAEQYYQRALQIFIEFNARYEQASIYHNLGAVAKEQRQWQQAEQYYQRALQIFIECNDRYEQAGTYHNLGIVAQDQRQWEQAQQYYQQALQISIEYHDRYGQAETYHNLGAVAREQRQWEQAEQYFQQALQIFIEFNAHYEQAGTYHNLGAVAREQRQWEQAKDYLLQALKIFVEYKDNDSVDVTVRNLARLWKESSDTELLTLVAQVLNVSVAQIEKFWQDVLENTNNEEDSENGEYQRAIADYNEALRLQPDSADAYHNRGAAYYAQGEYQRAIADYNEALRLQPDSASAYYNRGFAYAQLGEYQRVIADLDEALRLQPDSASAYLGRGLAYAQLGEYQRAIADYNEALRLQPDSANAYYYRGDAYLKQGEYQRAIADYNEALRLQPDSASVYHNRGHIYFKQGEYQRAIADYNEVLRLRPDSANAYLLRGFAYARQGEYQQAMADANEALRLQPDSANAYLMRGYAYLYLKRIEEASADFQRAAERAPNDVNMHWMVVFASLKRERPGREMADHLERIAAIDENSHYASTCQAVALGLRGNVKDGLRKLEQVLLKDPTSQDDLFWKGVLSAYYYDTTWPEVAIEAIEKALENGLPPVLLTPLYWLQKEQPKFFEEYAQPILERYGV